MTTHYVVYTIDFDTRYRIPRSPSYFSYLDSIPTVPNVGDLMDTNRNSVESQLRTRCNILESQVETLKKQKPNSPEKFIAKDGAHAEQWKDVSGIGRFPA